MVLQRCNKRVDIPKIIVFVFLLLNCCCFFRCNFSENCYSYDDYIIILYFPVSLSFPLKMKKSEC